MRKRVLFVMAALAALVLAALACSFNVSTAKIRDAYLASDQEGNQKTTVFSPSDTFYAIVDLANAPDDTKIKAVWTAVLVDTGESNVAIGEKEIQTGESLFFNLTKDTPWPAGKYKVEIYLNDELNRTLEFEVQGESSPPVENEAAITDAFMARDNEGTDRTTVFTPDDIFYCIVNLEATQEATVKAVWTAVEVQGEAPNTPLDEVETTSASARIPFNLSNTNPWSAGRYKIDLYLNGELDRSLEFEVQAGEEPPAASSLIQRVILARDEEGTLEATIFAPTDTFYAIVEMPDAPSDTVAKAVWYATQVEGEAPNTMIDEAEAQGSGTFTFNLSNNVPWPVGQYRVEIYVNGELALTLDFEVK